jgi:hypothetical protein
MATAAKKGTASRKASSKQSTARKGAARKGGTKRTSTKKSSTKKAAAEKGGTKKASAKKNKLGVKNSLVNNINAHKKRGDSKSKKKSTVNKKQYKKMQHNWEE